jgi:nitroreductase
MDHTDPILSIVKARRSVRRFESRPLPEGAEQRLLEALVWAPSGGNAQPWHFVLVRSEQARRALSESALSQRFVAEAPLVVVVCADLDRARRAYGERGATLYCLQDTAAATQNMLLVAHAMGLGTCWVGAFRERDVASVLGLASHLRPVAIVPVGWPAEAPAAPGRRAVAEVSESR